MIELNKLKHNPEYSYLNYPYSGYIKTSTFREKHKGEKFNHNKIFNYKYNEVGLASWYGENDGFHGKLTANGDIYNKDHLTAAHRTLPMPSMVKVTNLENNYSAIVMINDRGPSYKNRLIDLSAKTAEILRFKHQGLATVKVEYLPKQTEELLYQLGLKEFNNQFCQVEYVVQLGAFRDRINANKMAVKFQDLGEIEIKKNNHTNLYLVLLGPFTTNKQARKIAHQIEDKFKHQVLLIKQFIAGIEE